MSKCDNPECICGVTCCVEACKYHGEGNCCTAKHIDVKNSDARVQDETCCGTFKSLDTWSVM